MPIDRSIKTVLVLGSGPVIIGQAAEFDYSGSQACLSLREEGIKVVLLNSNPATIQTDHEIADRVYIEPINIDSVLDIIEAEHVDAILPTMGGQTALNLAIGLDKKHVLDNHGIKVLGTPIESIEIAEDRRNFHDLMNRLGEPIASSVRLNKDSFKSGIEELKFIPAIVRTSFSLGGSGGLIVRDKDQLMGLCNDFFYAHPDEELELEESIEGLKEIEYEVVRDNEGNCVIVCNMENLDPMGVHTGESVVVTPSQTLSDIEYQMLRDASIKIVSAIGIKGACNVQFALDQELNKYYVIEVNPRTSRSSALASKASGYPIARIATKITVGYNLNEIINPITKSTYAAFEPSLDYVTVKIPRWPFDKFSTDRTIGVQMKSIGEVMGIGRTFEEAFMKAIASLDTPESSRILLSNHEHDLESLLSQPSDLRIYAIIEALLRNMDPEKIAKFSRIDSYFIEKLKNLTERISRMKRGFIPFDLIEVKKLGIPDSVISAFTGISETDLVKERFRRDILPVYKAIDTCSGEFEAKTPYFYSTYDEQDEFSPPTDKKGTVLIIGSGPNRISQGLEFDYVSVKMIASLKKHGYRAVMINSNPETVSTDFDISDTLYFEPLTIEHVSNIVRRESPCKIIVQFSGQTGQNMAMPLQEIFGPDIFLGTSPENIEKIEDRTKFSKNLKFFGLKQPDFIIVNHMQEAVEISQNIDLPVIVRSSFIIGGRAMDIITDRETLHERLANLFEDKPDSHILVSKYIENATEIDVDFISNGRKSVICGILTHVEEAGTHSGDATMLMGPGIPDAKLVKSIQKIVDMLSREYDLTGLSNLQLAVKDGEIMIIELNARASRSVPFVCKATGIDWVNEAYYAIMEGKIRRISKNNPGYFVKIPAFPFNRFLDVDAVLGPEMKSTGEAMLPGKTLEEAVAKYLKFHRISLHGNSVALISVRDEDKDQIVNIGKEFSNIGIKIFATPGTRKVLTENGIDCDVVYKMEDLRRPNVEDFILEHKPDIVVNTPSLRSGPIRDGNQIRRLSVKYGIPLITNIKLATITLIGANSVATKSREIRSYWNIEQEKSN